MHPTRLIAAGQAAISTGLPQSATTAVELALTGLTLLKPKIVALVPVTSVVACVVAADGAPWWQALTLLALSGLLSAGGAAALNHFFDRDIDARMERTGRRPFPRGQISRRSCSSETTRVHPATIPSAERGGAVKGAIRTVIVLAALGLCLLLGAACAGRSTGGQAASAAVAKSAGDPAKGKELFGQSCVACHGPDARGLPGLGRDMTTSAFIKGQSDSQLIEFVKKGRPASDPANTTKIDMPARGGNPTITDAQLGDIVAYIRTLQR